MATPAAAELGPIDNHVEIENRGVDLLPGACLINTPLARGPSSHRLVLRK
jgi:hypothetical protein